MRVFNKHATLKAQHSTLKAAGCWLLTVGLTTAAIVPLTVTEPIGVARSNEVVTSGVPFPMGALKSTGQLRLVDEKGGHVSAQIQPLATWRDGSVKWALLDFSMGLPPHGTARLQLEYGAAGPAPATGAGIVIEESPDWIKVNTGRLQFLIGRKEFGLLLDACCDANRDGRFEESERVAKGLGAFIASARELPPEEVKVEEAGPQRAVVKVSGWFAATNQPVFKYIWRIAALADSATVRAQFTAIQLGKTNKLELVRSFGARLELADEGAGAVFGGERTNHFAGPGQPARIEQVSETQYQFAANSTTAKGFHCPGWAVRSPVLAAVRNFWQQYPKAIRADRAGLTFEFYSAQAKEPFDWDQGLAKTHELLIDFAAPTALEDCAAQVRAGENPLFAVAPSPWYCDSKVFGDLSPFNFDLFPDYETLTEASGDKFIKTMTTGIRNWGDFYYGGPYKGKNSFMDLEYDVPHNFLVQFARTGQRKYLDTARLMAQHQADIDINHFTGWQWKHSPRHGEIQAEFGHTFTRGLLESYFLTGNRQCLEAAVTLGDYFAKDIRNPRALGNERQIGWALISLLPVYEATWDQKYFAAARETIDRLLASLDARGKFDIRWDNRIAFFNGIAATGFIYYYRATGDERVADGALRVMRRALGMYPEYAGRTLEALAWSYQRTGDTNYLDALKLAYEATLAKSISWNTMELGAPTIFTVHALPFMEKSGLVRPPLKSLGFTPEQFASENGFYIHHLPAGAGEIFLKVETLAPFQVVIIRKGAWKEAGQAALYDPAGKMVFRREFPREAVLWQREVFAVKPTVPGAWRLALRAPQIPNVRSGAFITWDVATSHAMPAVMQTANNFGWEFVTPRLYTIPKAGETKVEIDLLGEGEGFKKAVLYDPAGHPAGAVEAFVDLGDKGRYEYKLTADIPPHQAGGTWSLSLQDVAVARLAGLAPYFSTSPQAFFQPDKPR